MRLIIQRVSEAEVKVDDVVVSAIGKGLLILLGVDGADTNEDVAWLCKKVVEMRIFADEEGKMNCSLRDVDGDALVVSQFTLHASVKKGNRPSFIKVARPEVAIPLYEAFQETLGALLGKPVSCGLFGADMQVRLCNDGPVTIMIDSQRRE
ncbi:MAG: D-aminoacyl-tRNA deacylase [Akkermansia sp.]